MLSKIKGQVSPEAFTALLTIFDTTWAAVEASGRLRSQEVQTARTEIATLVMDQAERPDLTETDRLRNEILQMFWSRHPPES
jgi:hypothetical protein